MNKIEDCYCSQMATKFYEELVKNEVKNKMEAAAVLIELHENFGFKATPMYESCIGVAMNIYFGEMK